MTWNFAFIIVNRRELRDVHPLKDIQAINNIFDFITLNLFYFSVDIILININDSYKLIEYGYQLISTKFIYFIYYTYIHI